NPEGGHRRPPANVHVPRLRERDDLRATRPPTRARRRSLGRREPPRQPLQPALRRKRRLLRVAAPAAHEPAPALPVLADGPSARPRSRPLPARLARDQGTPL